MLPSAALLALGAGTVLAQPGYPAMINYGGYGGRGGPARGIDFDWDTITGEGSGDMYAGYGRGGMGGRGQGDGDKPLTFKSELGKAIQKLRFDRTPASVLAARVKLAEQDRKALTSPVGPPTPEEIEDGAATPGGAGGMAGMGNDGMPGDGESFDMSDGDMDPAAMAERVQAMMAARMAAMGGPLGSVRRD
mgnify:CR=1 FL=1